MNPQEKLNFLRLARTKSINRTNILKLLNEFGSASEVIKSASDFLKKPIEFAPLQEIQKELELCKKIGAKIIYLGDEDYPKLLKEIPDPPLALTIRGNKELMHKNIMAIVGTRNSSINGTKFSEKIAKDLGNAGIIIASGLARGIDRAAHISTIETGTIGVIGCGIDNIYPRENKDVYEKIISDGLLISEFSYSTPPVARNFPERNRIISGLSLGTIVIEATLRSGTLITARCALEQNREVFAVPGSPFDPRYDGTNKLIKEGAHLIQNSDDILEVMNFAKTANLKKEVQTQIKEIDDDNLKKFKKMILEKISHTPTSIELVINELKIPIHVFNSAIIQMELEGKIESRNGKINLI